nr:uncharacterized protein LOC132765480 [Anolis sagrei ordinatus]
MTGGREVVAEGEALLCWSLEFPFLSLQFLGREELPWADSSLEVQRGSLTSSERAESSFLSEKSPTPLQNKLPKDLGSKEVGIPSELFLPEWVALDLNTESVNELSQKMDSDEATLADIASLEDEVWDPPPSSSSSLSHEEAVDMALHPRRWSSLDPEQVRPRVPPGQAWDHHPGGIAQCLPQEMKRGLLQRPSGWQVRPREIRPSGRLLFSDLVRHLVVSLATGKAKEHLHRLCQLVCSPSSAEAMQAVDYVARKQLKMATDHFLESNGRPCGELVCAVLNSQYCCLEAALDLFLAKVKEGPWLAQEGEEQGGPTWDAATARATRAIGGIIKHIRDSTRLEEWFVELLLALVTNFIEVTRPGLEVPSRNRSSSYVPPV